jgi:UDPglucose 6-dehydrogenase
LGCVYSACLAKLGCTVTGTDEDGTVVEDLREGKPPIFEPGLDSLIAGGIAGGNLRFVDDIEEGVKSADYVVIAYDTPVDAEDRVDLSPVFRAVTRLRNLARHATIVVSSQVPVGTCELIASTLSKGGMAADVAYVPENLRLGKAVECFMRPDMIVIGTNNPSATVKVRALFAPIPTRIIEMDLRSAEMTKHALNAFLATSISFANEIGNICDLVGADALKVAQALKSDSRIGPNALLRPGLGFSGGTLARDLRVIQGTAKKHGYESLLVDSVLEVNRRQNASIVSRLERLVGKLDGKSVGVLGLTYKAGTSTLRRSVALEIIRRLQQEGASVKAFDPRVSKSDLASGTFLLCDDVYAACENADVLVILNDWPGFLEVDFKKVRHIMKEPIVLDTQNLLDPRGIAECGIRYIGIGRGVLMA